MSTVASSPALSELTARAKLPTPVRPSLDDLMTDSERKVVGRAHALFVWLLPAQWLVAVAAALWLAPASGRAGFWLAAAGGALVTLPTIGLIRLRPYAPGTRAVVALAQVGFSTLLIAVCGGRAETHLHGFASMAFLAFYRDWRVLVVATAGVLASHVGFGFWQPAVIFEDSHGALGRAVEHGWWIIVENAALAWACVISRREMEEICHREERHQRLLDEQEARVAARTRELEAEMRARAAAAQELQRREQRHRTLIATLPIGIFETTQSGWINFANPYLLNLVGLPTALEARKVSLADARIIPAADRERLWRRLEADGEVRGFGLTLRHLDGTTRDVLINARLKTSAPGTEPRCEGTVEDVTDRKRAQHELDVLQGQLLVASRQAGMAEVATGVLHNVGNVLTSVNLIVHDVQDRLKTTRLTHLRRVVEILQREKPRLGEFVTTDATGRQIPDFLEKLEQFLTAENTQLLTDVEGLVRHFEHIREIIVTQQSTSQLFGLLETLAPAQLFEDALRLNAESMERHGITLKRLFEPAGSVTADRHKVLQILVNLIKNAKDALQVRKPGERIIEVRVTPAGDTHVALIVSDNGHGIDPADLTRIFQHGFTTKQSGHGFGLHSSVLAAREMGGDLAARSAGPGLGATFTLTLPIATTPAP